MKSVAVALLSLAAFLFSDRSPDASHAASPAVQSPTMTVVGQNAGPTPFIVNLQLTTNAPNAVKSISFTITPKPGSVTRPISATYNADYLQSRGYFDVQTGAITIPVFGLYASYSNNVTLTSCFTDESTEQTPVVVPTGTFNNPCSYANPTVTQARTNDTSLSYDYIMIKANCNGSSSPVIVDTDGAVRWIGTANFAAFSSIFHQNQIYLALPPSGSSEPTGITRMDLDGTNTFLKDYSSMGVTSTAHHNYDPGRDGILVAVNTTAWTESVILEIDPATGNVIRSWNLAEIISDAMVAGGDDPNQFVQPAPNDWFHNNSATYRASDNSLIVSSRENFVIDLDYDTGAIRWILGDPTKQWHQFASLRQYALALGANTLPPIGQHAVSITSDDDLLLFDNGTASLDHTPAGASRSYSAPRKYQLDLVNRVATEVWDYPNGQSLYADFCSSIYEDAPLNYLIDYASVAAGAPILIGLNSTGNTVFNYRYQNGCNTGWNAIPIHLEQLLFTGPTTKTFQIQSIARGGNDVSIVFPAVKNNTYRLEYKTNINDTIWSPISDYTSSCSGLTTLTDSPSGQVQRFYRVTQL